MLTALKGYEARLEALADIEGRWVKQKIKEGEGALEFDRCWIQLSEHARLYVHRIPPAPRVGGPPAFFHAHGWEAMAVHVLGPGKYEMGLGFGPEVELESDAGGDAQQSQPPIVVTTHAPPGFQYSIESRQVWHYIHARDKPVFTIMLTLNVLPRSELLAEVRERLYDPSEAELIDICARLFTHDPAWYHL